MFLLNYMYSSYLALWIIPNKKAFDDYLWTENLLIEPNLTLALLN